MGIDAFNQRLLNTYTYTQFGNTSHGSEVPWHKQKPSNNLNGNNYVYSYHINKAVIKDRIAPESISGWFKDCSALTEIEGLAKLDTSLCTDMSYAFGSIAVPYLDLSTFNTSNVTNINYFISGTSKIEEIKATNFDLSKVENLRDFIKAGWYDSTGAQTIESTIGPLRKVDITGIKLTNVKTLRTLVTYTRCLQDLDISDVKPEYAYEMQYLFQYNFGLKKIKLGNWQAGKKVNYRGDSKTIWLDSMFYRCESLEEVDFSDFSINTADGFYSQCSGFFQGCKKLTTLTHFENLFNPDYSGGSWSHRLMFENCESLEEVDFSFLKGYIGGMSIFKGCTNLKKINLGQMGTMHTGDDIWQRQYGFNSYDYKTISNTEKEVWRNYIYEGCENISEFTFSEYYPPQNLYYPSNSSNAGQVHYPNLLTYYPKTFTYNGDTYNYTYVAGRGVDNPDIPPVTQDRLWVKIAQPENGPFSIASSELLAVGETLPASELFGNFQKKYAGTWVTESKIALNAKGGTPAQQTFSGAVGMQATGYNAEEIQKPVRNGYNFLGWFAKYTAPKLDEQGETVLDENGKVVYEEKEEEIDPEKTVKAWTYYAKWDEYTYTIRLHKNLRPVDEEEQTPGDIVEYTVKYSEPLKLPDNLFTHPTNENSVITSWNMRSNGSGSGYATNDSVDKLTLEDKGVIDLYAQWHSPAAVITFDTTTNVPAGVTDVATTVAKRSYNDTQHDVFQDYYSADGKKSTVPLSSSYLNDDYSFAGWFRDGETEPVTDNTRVDKSETLYAKWVPKPQISFDLQGGHIRQNDDGTYTKICEYNKPIGDVPLPVKTNSTFMGWYTAPYSDDDNNSNDGEKINTDTCLAIENLTYYAHWGYQPKFDTNGGSFAKDSEGNFINPSYSVQIPPQITLSSLPHVEKEGCTFDGWYIGDTQICDGNYTIKQANVNLSDGDTLQAHWITPAEYTIKLYKEASDHNTEVPVNDKPFQTVKVYAGKASGQFDTPTKDDYDFGGWYTEPNGGGTKITDSTVITSEMVDGDDVLVLYAKWTQNTITVNFHKNASGDNAENAKLVDAPSEDTYSTTVPTGKCLNPIPGANWLSNAGTSIYRSFVGWNTSADGTGDWLTSSTEFTTGPVDYYAQWEDLTKKQDIDIGDGNTTPITTLIQWGTLSDDTRRITNIGDDLILYPNTNISSDISVNLNLNFIKDSHYELEKDELEIRIPKALFKDWSDSATGSDDVGTATTDDPDYNTNNPESKGYDFLRTESEDGEYYIITNLRNPQPSSEFKLTYTVSPKNVRGGYLDENGEYHNYYGEDRNKDGKRDESEGKFHISIVLKGKGENGADLVLDERDLGVEFHNNVSPTVTKTQTNIYYQWDREWGDVPPSDADNYIYIKWQLKANVDACNQPYYLNWSEDTVHDGAVVYCDTPSVLGTDDQGEKKWSPELYGGSYEIYVVTKHLRGEVKEGTGEWKQFKNEAILSLKLKSDTEGVSPQKYRVSKDTYAFVENIVGEGDRELIKYTYDPDVKKALNNDDHFKYGGQDLVLSRSVDDPSFSLDYYIKYYEKYNVDSPTALEGGEVSTKTRRYVFTDGAYYSDENGESKDLKIAQKSSRTGRTDEYKPLEDNDYCFRYLDFSITEYTAKSLEGEKWSAPYPITKSADYGNINIYIRKANKSTFELYKTVNGSELVDPSSEYGASEIGLKVKKTLVELPTNTAGYRVEYSSDKYTTDIKIHASMGLNPSSRMQSIVASHVEDDVHTLITNKCGLDIYRKAKTQNASWVKDEAPLLSTKYPEWYASWVLTPSQSEINAYMVTGSQSDNNADGRYYITDVGSSTITYATAMEGWVRRKSTDGFIKRVTSGIFYNLLPKGNTVDKNSIKVVARATGGYINKVEQNSNINFVLQSNYNIKKPNWFTGSYKNDNSSNIKYPVMTLPTSAYSVSFIDNWENTGQTMMVINVSCPDDIVANGYGVYYLGQTSINNVHINGREQTSFMSFTDTTPGQSEPNERFADYSTQEKRIKEIFERVNNTQTAYANGTITLNTPSLYQYGADSTVTTAGSDIARFQLIGLNTDYFYHVSYEGSSSCQSSELVIYDVLEKQIGGNNSQWEGTFQGIDVSNIKEQESAVENGGNCAPKVYYSTVDKTKFTKEMFSLDAIYDGKPVWTTAVPEDLTTVTAVAVDCRHSDSADPTKQDFMLPRSAGIDFTIKMTSPDNKLLADKYTYNEAVIKGKNLEIDSPIESSARTSVKLKYSEPKFSKTSLPASGTAGNPEGVVYKSVLNYTLKITNTDTDIAMNQIKVRDVFPITLLTNNTINVRFGKGAYTPIDNSARVVATITTEKNDQGEEVSRIFEATIDTLDRNESVEIVIPVQVTEDIGHTIENTAEIFSMNGSTLTGNNIIKSDTTYHKVTGVQAKIQKLNAAGDPLSNAVLQILDPSNNNQPIELKTDDPDNEGRQISHGTEYTTDGNVWCFNVPRGEYILHEKTAPEGYSTAADIRFEIDLEGALQVITIDEETQKTIKTPVTYVTMVDEPDYKVVFHANNDAIDEDIFTVVQCNQLVDNRVPAFDAIPEIEGNRFTSFTGWYTERTGGNRVTFSQTYDGETGFVTENGTKVYNIYAHWEDYKVIFHENNPNAVEVEPFRTFENKDRSAIPQDGHYYLDKEFKIPHFYDLPAFAKDDYVFAGWYYYVGDRDNNVEPFSSVDNPDGATMMPVDFENTEYLKRDGLTDPNYHIYAKWIPVGEVAKDGSDTNKLYDNQGRERNTYSGFGLDGVQVRPGTVIEEENMQDSNFDNAQTSGGLRFVTSLSESLISKIKGIDTLDRAASTSSSFGVEYGYAVATLSNINHFYDHYKDLKLIKNKSDYKLQYQGDNVNGYNTQGLVFTPATDYRYVKNVNCTSRQKGTSGVVNEDHRNYYNYRLYTLVVTYDDATDAQKAADICARSYLRYYDGNGKLRVFYNDYNDNAEYFGGCKCNFTQALDWYNQSHDKIN